VVILDGILACICAGCWFGACGKYGTRYTSMLCAWSVVFEFSLVGLERVGSMAPGTHLCYVHGQSCLKSALLVWSVWEVWHPVHIYVMCMVSRV